MVIKNRQRITNISTVERRKYLLGLKSIKFHLGKLPSMIQLRKSFAGRHLVEVDQDIHS